MLEIDTAEARLLLWIKQSDKKCIRTFVVLVSHRLFRTRKLKCCSAMINSCFPWLDSWYFLWTLEWHSWTIYAYLPSILLCHLDALRCMVWNGHYNSQLTCFLLNILLCCFRATTKVMIRSFIMSFPVKTMNVIVINSHWFTCWLGNLWWGANIMKWISLLWAAVKFIPVL